MDIPFKYWRCVFAQSVLKGLLWVALISAAGYGAYYRSFGECDATCVKAWRLK